MAFPTSHRVDARGDECLAGRARCGVFAKPYSNFANRLDRPFISEMRCRTTYTTFRFISSKSPREASPLRLPELRAQDLLLQEIPTHLIQEKACGLAAWTEGYKRLCRLDRRPP